MDNRGSANDQADPTRGQPLEVVDVRMGRDSAFHQAGSRRQGDETVPEVETAEPERREDVGKLVGHLHFLDSAT